MRNRPRSGQRARLGFAVRGPGLAAEKRDRARCRDRRPRAAAAARVRSWNVARSRPGGGRTSALWRTPPAGARCREGSPGLRRRGGRTRAMRAVMRSAPRGAKVRPPPGREAISCIPHALRTTVSMPSESFSRPSASGTPSHASCPGVTASSPNSSVGRCSEPTFSSPKGRHAMGPTETVGSVVPAPRRGIGSGPRGRRRSRPRLRGEGRARHRPARSLLRHGHQARRARLPMSSASRRRARGRAAANASSSRRSRREERRAGTP